MLKKICLFILLWMILLWWREILFSNWLVVDKSDVGTFVKESLVYDPQTYREHIWHLKTYEHIDGKIMYIDEWYEDDKVIVFLHWTPTSSWLWRNIVSWLVDKWYRVIAPDLLWYGMSDKPVWRQLYTVDQQGKRIQALLTSLGIKKYTLWWHDQWSLWMRYLLSNNTDQVESLIVLNSIVDREWFQAPSIYWKQNLFTKTISTLRWSKLLWRVLGYMSFGGWVVDSKKIDKNTLEWYLIPLLSGASLTNYYFISDFNSVYEYINGLESVFQDLDIPTMILRGKQDNILNFGQIQRLKTRLSISEKDIHIYPDAKHFIQEEYPQDIVNDIHDFMQIQ